MMTNRTFVRWATSALLTLGLILVAVAPASAAWKYEPIKWRHGNAGALGFSVPQPNLYSDTTFISAAPARADTTTAWSMLDSEPFPGVENGATATTADTIAAGYVVIAGDSTVASTVDFTNTTVTIQVNYGVNSTGWQTIQSATSPLATAGTKALLVPMYQRLGAITTDLGIDFKHPGDIFAPQVRAIVTWGTAAAVPSARVYVKKWVGRNVIQRDAPKNQ